MNQLSFIKLIGIALATASMFSCSEVSFTQLKDAKLKGTSAFGEGTNKESGGTYLEGLILGGEITEQLYPPAEFVETLTVDIERVCSDSRSERSHLNENFEVISEMELLRNPELLKSLETTKENLSNVQLAKEVALVIRKGNQIVCVDTETNYRDDLINLTQLEIPIKCQLQANEHYSLQFVDTRYLQSGESLGEIRIRVGRDGKLKTTGREELRILYATNPKRGEFNALNTGENFDLCDKFSSPLVVQLSDEPIELSSITDGIQFEIKGAKNGYQKSQISWPVNDAMAFIALPDVSGSVHNIDQLFGDSTLGPDGKFADDGYAALAKYDDNQDNKIDEKDAIFEHLRLFIDDNRDGQSQAGELQSLRSQGIYSIDLEFEADYAEQDIFGNKILFKSVAETDAGMMLIFDIWFRHAGN